MKSRRAYHSPSRAEYAAQTRRSIIRALVELLVEERPTTVSIPAIARRADVSVRTVYHHFPTKAALFDALSEATHEPSTTAGMRDPASPAELVDAVPTVFAFYEQHSALFNAVRLSEAGEHVASRVDQRSVERWTGALQPLAGWLDATEFRRLRGVVGALMSYETYRTMTRRGLGTAEAASAVQWAVRTVIDRARRTGKVGL